MNIWFIGIAIIENTFMRELTICWIMVYGVFVFGIANFVEQKVENLGDD